LPEPLVPILASFVEQFEAVKRDARNLFAGVTEAQFNWRPEPGRWSMGDCVAHLNVSASIFVPKINTMIAEAQSKGYRSQGPYKHTWLGHLLASTIDPPPRFRVKAPKVFRPPLTVHPLDQTTADLLRNQDAFIDCARRANGLDLGAVRTTSPVTSLIKLTLEEALQLQAGHERRHLWQARNVKTALPER
jgi:hypothetical protein